MSLKRKLEEDGENSSVDNVDETTPTAYERHSEKDKQFLEIIKKALMAEAKNAVAADKKKQAYLFGVDWERMGHGKDEGPGRVIVAQGMADALLKLENIGNKMYENILDYEEIDEDIEGCLSPNQSVSKKSIRNVIRKLTDFVQEEDYGVRVWSIVDIN